MLAPVETTGTKKVPHQSQTSSYPPLSPSPEAPWQPPSRARFSEQESAIWARNNNSCLFLSISESFSWNQWFLSPFLENCSFSWNLRQKGIVIADVFACFLSQMSKAHSQALNSHCRTCCLCSLSLFRVWWNVCVHFLVYFFNNSETEHHCRCFCRFPFSKCPEHIVDYLTRPGQRPGVFFCICIDTLSTLTLLCCNMSRIA